MKLVGLSAEAAEDALVLWGRHVPPGVELGRPVVAVASGHGGAVDVLSDLALWTVTSDGVDRLLPLAGGCTEVTRWRAGEEVSRVAGPVG